MVNEEMNEQMNREYWWSDTDRVKPYYMETCPYANVSTRKPTWTGLGLNYGLQSEMLANDHLSHEI
jgi:hypothetical protein